MLCSSPIMSWPTEKYLDLGQECFDNMLLCFDVSKGEIMLITLDVRLQCFDVVGLNWFATELLWVNQKHNTCFWCAGFVCSLCIYVF